MNPSSFLGWSCLLAAAVAANRRVWLAAMQIMSTFKLTTKNQSPYPGCFRHERYKHLVLEPAYDLISKSILVQIWDRAMTATWKILTSSTQLDFRKKLHATKVKKGNFSVTSAIRFRSACLRASSIFLPHWTSAVFMRFPFIISIYTMRVTLM